jgi:hypothetical protein
VLGKVEDYNLVAYGGYVYALSQSLGEVDVTIGPERPIERRGTDRVIVANSADGARARVEASFFWPGDRANRRRSDGRRCAIAVGQPRSCKTVINAQRKQCRLWGSARIS